MAGSDLLGDLTRERATVREGVEEKGLGERAEAVGLAGGLGLYLPLAGCFGFRWLMTDSGGRLGFP